jgi:hypothetical protein
LLAHIQDVLHYVARFRAKELILSKLLPLPIVPVRLHTRQRKSVNVLCKLDVIDICMRFQQQQQSQSYLENIFTGGFSREIEREAKRYF